MINKPLIIFLAGAVVIIGAGLLIFKSPVSNPSNISPITPSPVACTMEAKLCPDGSYVGRSGPNCEFAMCPTATITPTPQKSGVTGTVTLSPTCPVERMPPDPQCAPRSYATSIDIMKTGSTSIIATVKSNNQGVFSANLDAGAYTLRARVGSILPRCADVSVLVKSGQYAKADISCDTGIR